MGEKSYLAIGDDGVWSWNNELPSENSALNLIFGPTDRISEEPEEGYSVYGYRISVGEALQRLNELGFTEESVKSTIANLTDVPKDEVYASILSYDEVWDKFGGGSEEVKANERNQEKIETAHLGHLDEILRLIKHLNSHDEDEDVFLDLTSPVSAWKLEFEEWNIYKEEKSTDTRLERTYLDFAKAHLSEGKYDLVHIEAIIALENQINTLIQKYPGSKDFNIPNTIDNLSFIKKLRFIFFFLHPDRISNEVIDKVERFYKTRSNIIHNNAKTFTPETVAEGLQATESILEELQQISEELEDN